MMRENRANCERKRSTKTNREPYASEYDRPPPTPPPSTLPPPLPLFPPSKLDDERSDRFDEEYDMAVCQAGGEVGMWMTTRVLVTVAVGSPPQVQARPGSQRVCCRTFRCDVVYCQTSPTPAKYKSSQASRKFE